MIDINKEHYITAEEAHQISTSITNGKMLEELDFIYNEIHKTMYEGKNSIKFSYKSFLKSTIQFLKDKGFKIEHFTGCQWDPADDLTISW